MTKQSGVSYADFRSFRSTSQRLAPPPRNSPKSALRALFIRTIRHMPAISGKLSTGLSIEIASSGGDITRDRLVEKLKQTSFRLAEERRSFTTLAALAEASSHVLPTSAIASAVQC